MHNRAGNRPVVESDWRDRAATKESEISQSGSEASGFLPVVPTDTGGRRQRLARQASAPFGCGVAAVLALALALPMVRAAPVHMDETTILDYGPHSLPTVVHDIFLSRGGAPLQFVVAHFTLQWPGGVEGLRVPSVLFTLLAIVLAGAWGERLAGRGEGVALAFLLASAPLAVELATFGRMYGMFLFAVLGASLLSLRAAARGRDRDWALAGAAAGALVYVHPIAPLYAGFALLTGIAWSRDPPGQLWRSLRASLIAAAVVAAPYVWALAVLARRYDVGTSSTLSQKGDRPVALETLLGMSPGGDVLAALTLALAAIGLYALGRRTPRVALLLGLWIVTPVVFFSVIPANTRFFVRYVVPALPPFLLLVATGSFVIGRRVGHRSLVAVAIVGALVVMSVRDDIRRIENTRAVAIERLLPLSSVPHALLFSSTGSPSSDPEHLDTYVKLRRPGIRQLEELPSADPRFDPAIEEKGVAAVAVFLQGTVAPGRGVWIFRGPERRVAHAERALEHVSGVASTRASDTLLVVTSTRDLPARQLVEQAIAVRRAWSIRSPSDRWAETLARIDRAALSRTG